MAKCRANVDGLAHGRNHPSHRRGWVVNRNGIPTVMPQLRVWTDGYTAWVKDERGPWHPTEREREEFIAALPEEAKVAHMKWRMTNSA